jgi:hypothetical protein
MGWGKSKKERCQATPYLPQRCDVQGLVDQTFTSEHREHELVQTHALFPDMQAPDDLAAQLQVLAQLLPLHPQLRLLFVVEREVLDRHGYQQRREDHIEYQEQTCAVVVLIWKDISESNRL